MPPGGFVGRSGSKVGAPALQNTIRRCVHGRPRANRNILESTAIPLSLSAVYADGLRIVNCGMVRVGVLLVRDGQVFVGLRCALRANYPAVWDAFGGHAYHGERPCDALVREQQEEIGVTPTKMSLLHVAQHSGPVEVRVSDLPDHGMGRHAGNRQPKSTPNFPGSHPNSSPVCDLHIRLIWICFAGRLS
jgi:NUDIX domain